MYDVLSAYKDYLLRIYQPETANTYYKRLCTLFTGQSAVNTVINLDLDQILHNLSTIKHKNYFSQSKNALLHFCAFQCITLSPDELNSIAKLEKTTKKKYRKLNEVDFNQVDKKIKRIRNIRLKTSYQVLIATGLRVSELSGISPNDCNITDNEITFTFTGKGGKQEAVSIQAKQHPMLYKRTIELISTTPQDKKLFYSAPYLQKRAAYLGFACHDLRRAYAKLEYKQSKSKNVVMEKLRHSNVRNTNIYLKSKVNV